MTTRSGTRRYKAFRALASPVRHEIVDYLAAGPPMSVAELARMLGRSPHSLYFHIQQLQAAGLVEPAGERRLARHVETLYTGTRIMPIDDYDLGDRACREAMAQMASSMRRVAARDFERGLASPDARPVGKRRNLWTARTVAWVSPEDLERANALLMSLADVLSTTRDTKRRERIAVQWTVAPAPPRTSERGSRNPHGRGGGRKPRKGRPRRQP